MNKLEDNRPSGDPTPSGIVVAGLSGGSGKSVVAVGLTAALARQGCRVAPFKKGPDYIDAGWLGMAAGRPCYNLDPYLLERQVLLDSFHSRVCDADHVVVEGNRGLFDGVDHKGAFSTAELSVDIRLPVLLVVDCTKSTRTVAALVAGCQKFDRRVEICGVVLNRIGSSRHERIVRQSVEHYTEIPVIGAYPRAREDVFPQRHLGITPGPEHEQAELALATLADRAGKYLDLEMLIDKMTPVQCRPAEAAKTPAERVRIGLVRDAAFQFYYQENIDELVGLGAEIVEIDAMAARELPPLDALYIGGGFPETSAGELAANRGFLDSLRREADRGLPIYAECGGLIYLGRGIRLAGQEYGLADILPASFSLSRRPQAHGYTNLRVTEENAFYPVGTRLKGHEFRYSRVEEWQGEGGNLAMAVDRGVGFADGRDGLVYKNVLALYTHVHALGTPEWARGMVAAARKYRDQA